MKKLIPLTLLLITLIGLPHPALASWPLTLHDDGGPYQAMAVDSRGKVAVAAVVTPAAIELTASSAQGNRLGWGTVPLPQEMWQQPRRLVWIKLYRSRLDVVVVAGDGDLSWGRRYEVPVTSRRGSVSFGTPTEGSFAVPSGARGLAVWQGAGATYIVWRTQNDEGIASVRMARLP